MNLSRDTTRRNRWDWWPLNWGSLIVVLRFRDNMQIKMGIEMELM